MAENLIAENLPAVRPTDTGQQVLNLMEACRVTQLPVVKEKEYLGLISDRLVYDFNLTGKGLNSTPCPCTRRMCMPGSTSLRWPQ